MPCCPLYVVLPNPRAVHKESVRIASYSKLARSPFSFNTNDANAAAIFLHIFSVRAGPSSSGYVHISQRGFKAISRSAFHWLSCAKYSRALRQHRSSKFVKCASRKRAAPRSQLVEPPPVGVGPRFGWSCSPRTSQTLQWQGWHATRWRSKHLHARRGSGLTLRSS